MTRESTCLDWKWHPWGVNFIPWAELQHHSNVVKIYRACEARIDTEGKRVRNLTVQSSTSEIMKPNKICNNCDMYILPITLFYLCPVLELQRYHEWGTICATHGSRRSRHHCPVLALALALYQLHQLQLLHPEFEAFGVADKRLTETSDLNRGCGGIAILWHKSLATRHTSGCPIRSNLCHPTKALFIILCHDHHWSVLALHWPPDWRIWQLSPTARRYYHRL